ncbi:MULTISPECIES: GntR family transcriptional regulator [Mammaliicoccus]|uniref:GntR family transcriptional regulator n=1 Tax=Mammaliicoccus vitulinus TaxID=71237 RepID=A0A2T4PU19_9STAP|nr:MULTISPECIES: GntR family transcriptional regulator [Mammaliicoccus]PTI29891.1 GntR family transcriptional regulator [Mammaliicoccus vitulinus]PTI36267.1 GntR family transcriptional regulator [Mammaliicoccus vitulinus]PTI71767.1 GntR family transcriptional regulator [Mammaliicoccus vitulinus]PTI89351.1 GntR family transcriptional regulator [Mammaliicoccus vitulinus]QQT14436.1 GntR family transcriptional regulator [Mammaliicoccus vitulinus]
MKHHYHYPSDWLKHRSTGEQVASELRLAIISKEIAEGEKLSENKIAQQFEVSRSPVRDALKLLQQDGLISLERMGAIVTGLSNTNQTEIYDIRLMLESFVFERLQLENNIEVIKQLNKILKMMTVAVEFKDADEFTRLDLQFHESMITAINHQYIEMIWYNLTPVMECLILVSMRQRMQNEPEDFERVIHNHQVYNEAIETKDRNKMKEAFHLNFDDVDEQIDVLWNSQTNIERK